MESLDFSVYSFNSSFSSSFKLLVTFGNYFLLMIFILFLKLVFQLIKSAFTPENGLKHFLTDYSRNVEMLFSELSGHLVSLKIQIQYMKE